tara:strand:- start:1656 stop:2429 length:774 start_codon:yes stop_codon:yes gene_type:complete
MYENAWIIDPLELIDSNKILDVFPAEGLSLEGPYANNTLNSLTRFFIYYGLFVGVFTGKYKTSFTNTLLAMLFMAIIYLFFNRRRMYYGPSTQPVLTRSMGSSAKSTQPRNMDINKTNTIGSTIDNTPIDQFNSSLNNPYSNPLIYSNCNTSFKNNLNPNLGIGQRSLVNGVIGKKPSEHSLMTFQKGVVGITNNIDPRDTNRQILEKQQINNQFRQFFTLPVNGCVNDQKSFAQSLYGNPGEKTFKQMNIESKFIK